MYNYESQVPPGQDRFVSSVLNFKRHGFFVDIGAHYYKYISNTYFLEKELKWSGLAVEIDSSIIEDWQTFRPKSNLIIGDATLLDYQLLLDTMNAPKIIDYLSVDIEPPIGTLNALLKILETNYEYKIITFEIDSYRGDSRPKDISRQTLIDKGFKRIEGLDNEQDDFWVNPKYIEKKYKSIFCQ
jgi:hypothetical protein